MERERNTKNAILFFPCVLVKIYRAQTNIADQFVPSGE